MSGKKSPLTPLESQKRLLVVESELNRVQLMNELHSFQHELAHLKRQAEAVASIAASVAKLAATFTAVGSAFSHREEKSEGRHSLLSTLFSGLKTGAALWGTLRSNQK